MCLIGLLLVLKIRFQLLTGRLRAGDLLFVLGQLGLKPLSFSGKLQQGLQTLFLLGQPLRRLDVMLQFFLQILLPIQQLIPFGGCGPQLIFLGTQLILKLFDPSLQCLIGLGGSV